MIRICFAPEGSRRRTEKKVIYIIANVFSERFGKISRPGGRTKIVFQFQQDMRLFCPGVQVYFGGYFFHFIFQSRG